MAEKQLIVAVETTGALGPYWNSLLSEYIEKIVRAFGNESTGQRLGGGEFSMVIFNSHANNNCFMWQRTGWTKNVDYYLSWLSGVHFSGGGFNDACIAEGLSETLIMLHDPSKNEGVSGEIKKHVVLVCASNPYPLPTPVYKPDVPVISDNNADSAYQHPALADAETLARYFPHCGISLSVISPKQLPKLRAIYNAARRNPRAADSAVDQVKYGHNLVLLSENFLEARSALNQPINGNTLSNPIVLKSDVGPTAPPVPVGPTGQNQNSIPSVNPSLMNRPMSAANMPPTANIKAEPVTGPGFSHQPNSSLSPISQETNSTILQNNPSNPNNPNNTLIDTTMQDLKPPQMSSSANPVRPVGPAPANVSILNNLSQLRQGGAASMGLPTIGGPTPIAVHMSNMISGTGSGTGLQTNSGIGSFGSAGPGAQSNTGIGFNNNPGSGSNVSGSLGNNAGNLQGMVGQLGQGGSGSTMVMNANTNSNNNQGLTGTGMMNSNNSQSLTGTSMVMNNSSSQGITGTGMVMNNNSNSQGLTGTGMGSVPGSMMSQQQTAGMSAIGMQQHPNAQQSQSKYVKIWEGTLSGQRQGQPVFICKLEGYRSASASDTLAGDWPSTMQIVRLIAQEHMNNNVQ